MHLVLRTAAAAIGTLAASLAFAQAYPAKPIKMILPIPAGSVTDVVGRGLAQWVNQAWGQPVVAENRAGANGTLGMEECARSAGDGYTVCMTDGNIMTINPFAYSRLPYDPLGFVPIAHLADLEVAVAVNAALPVNNMRELVDYVRTRPGQVTWGSTGAGSTPHMYIEWFQAKTGVQFNHIPYKGPAQLQQAMAAGEVDIANMSPASIAPYAKSGKVRFIGVAAGQRRSTYITGLPTFSEQGFDIDFRNWLALVAPKGTPNDIARRWNAEANKAIADKAWTEKVMISQALTPTGGSPEDLVAILEAKRKLGAELARIAKLKYD